MEREALIRVLRETRALLARPENNFSWSSWKDGEAALKEFDALIVSVSSDASPDVREFSFLFAPTGPVQEVSVSSGWGEMFLELAARFDAATR